MNKERPVVLVGPPPSDPTQPYSSLPMLTGFLRSKGLDVVQIDLGVQLFDKLMEATKLEQARRRAESRLNEIEVEDGFKERFYKIIGLSDHIIEHVGEAKAIMRDPERFYDLSKYEWASSVLKMGCELASLPSHPTILTPYNYITTARPTFKDMLDASSHRTDNLFFNEFSTETVPEILSNDPLLVGISVTYVSQIVPAFTLARLLKEAAPELHVSIGGATISQMESQIMRDPTCFQFADSYVVGEGETALLTIALNILQGRVQRSVPNTIFEENGKAIAGKMWGHEEIEKLPPPDFDGLQLEKYLSPEPVLMISSSRGCYYGKCAFCNVSMNTKQKFRSLTKGETASIIRGLHSKYGAERFFFCDDAIPVRTMLEVAKTVEGELPSITWAGEARLEDDLTDETILSLKRGGCRELIFGLESASQRVLDKMNKKNTVEGDMSILTSCSNAGLAVNMQTFIGFPTETHEEAEATIKFLVENEKAIFSYGFGTFQLFKDTPVFNDPDRYGIRISQIPNEDEFTLSYPMERSSGMTREQVNEMYGEALDRIDHIYGARTNYLCRAAGAHALLHLSFIDFREMHAHWDRNRVTRRINRTLPDDARLIVPDHILLSYHFDPSHTFKHRALDTKTGDQFDLSSEEQMLLQLCDGSRTVKEMVDGWRSAFSHNDAERTKNLAKGLILINELNINGLVREIQSNE
jgi:anaerobic magnesium-protoporphyrin IX monomethyl ester cyclase